jgi:DNA repair exonuclease SbcCD nuclease subunit
MSALCSSGSGETLAKRPSEQNAYIHFPSYGGERRLCRVSTLRLLHVADTHLDAFFPAQGAAARLRRASQLVDRFHSAVTKNAGFSGGRPADLCILAGDVFDNPRPSAAALAGASGPLLSLAAQDLPVFIVPGNHDRVAVSHSILLTHPRIHLFAQPGSVLVNVRGLRVRIIGIPWQRTAQAFLGALAETYKQHAPADVVILACHQAFRGAVCGAHDFRFTRGDDVIDPADLPPDISYVAAGHVHRYQSLTGGRHGSCQIVYAGSTDRMSFAERDEAKGCVVATWENGLVSHEFRAHPVRPMQVVPLDVTGLDAAGLRRRLDDTIMALPPEAMAELRLTGETTPDVVRGLRLTSHARRLRPDIDLRTAFQAVRFVPERVARRPVESPISVGSEAGKARTGGNGEVWLPPSHRRAGAAPPRPEIAIANAVYAAGQLAADAISAFAGVCDPVIPAGRVPVGAVAGLPELCGTYAMWSADGRLLYIGKARRLRTRVRSHLRLKGPSNFFTGWAREIAEIEFRPAESELEAALVEAALIQALRPPFNRQYRGWEDGCYFVSSGGPHEELAVAPNALPGAEHFGPFGRRFGAQLMLDAVNAIFGCAQCPSDGRRGKGRVHRPAPLLGGGR